MRCTMHYNKCVNCAKCIHILHNFYIVLHNGIQIAEQMKQTCNPVAGIFFDKLFKFIVLTVRLKPL